MSRVEQLFGSDLAAPVPILPIDFACSTCHRTHATLAPGPDNGYLLRFNPAGLGIRHVRGTLYSLYCPGCGQTEEHDLPLPVEEFDRVMAEETEIVLVDDGNDGLPPDHPFGEGE